jgi:methyl-accepting chemotaxis protein
VTQRTASAAEELASTAEEMAAQAESLQQLVSFFKLSQAERSHAVTPVVTPAQPKPGKPRKSREWYAVPQSFQAPSHSGNGKSKDKEAASDDERHFSRF